MGALAFIASLARSLAWPAAMIALAFIFRVQIRKVIEEIAKRIPQVRSAKVGPLEVHLDINELASAKAEMAQVSAAAFRQAAAPLSQSLYLQPFRAWRSPGWRWSGGLPDFDIVDTGAPEDARAADGEAAITAQYALQAMTVRSLQNDAAPPVTILSAATCLETQLREIAGLLGISNPGSPAQLADAVITELDRRGGLPAPEQARSVVRRLLSLSEAARNGAGVTKLEAIDYAEIALQITGLLLNAYVTTGRKPEPESTTQAANETSGTEIQQGQ
jgi:hypothetical protein